jgi:tRNA modification GTPase
MATLCKFYDAEGGLLDRGLTLFFPSPQSFTGEDVAELHVHGGRAIIDAISNRLRALGARDAEGGAFTKRAFLNGKCDLTAAEAIHDLVMAETEMQRQMALLQAEGGLHRFYQTLTNRALKLLAHQEAEIEFPDEDLPLGLSQSLITPLKTLIADITHHLNDDHKGERLKDGIRIAIIGAPNAGKSSLLNALARRDAAIVSPIAGTTRDVVDVYLNLAGFPVILSDTAGLRHDTPDVIEKIGIKKSRQTADQATLILALFDGTAKPDATLIPPHANVIRVMTKADLPFDHKAFADDHKISTQTGEGLENLITLITTKLQDYFKDVTTTPHLTQNRHRVLLTQAVSELTAAQNAHLPELAAEHLRRAIKAMGAITGNIHVEDILDVVFKDFCIGK